VVVAGALGGSIMGSMGLGFSNLGFFLTSVEQDRELKRIKKNAMQEDHKGSDIKFDGG